MNYEEFKIKKGRMFGWMLGIGVLLFLLLLWINLGISLMIILLVYVLFCAFKYIQFIEQYPEENKADKLVSIEINNWWGNLNWKEKINIYRKHKVVIK